MYLISLGPEYNCRLYHMDHWSLPDGPSAFLLNDRPLIDNGGRIGTFYENRCQSKFPRIFPSSLCAFLFALSFIYKLIIFSFKLNFLFVVCSILSCYLSANKDRMIKVYIKYLNIHNIHNQNRD